MQKVITKSIMQNSDKYMANHESSLELMNKAAAAVMNSYPFKGKVLIVTGTGNNAGDGYALALILNKAGIEVNILQTKEEYSKDGKYYYNLCQKNNIITFLYNETFDFRKYNVLVDAIYGIGFKGNMPEKIANLIKQMNESNIPIVSIDINSGLDADNGLAKICIHSTLTVSIGTLKPGHLLNMAKDYIDKLVNQNIGIDIVGKPYYLLEKDDFKGFLPKRANYSHKGTYGLVGILGGSLKYSGSVKLASLSLSALTSGAGVARLMTLDIIDNLAKGNDYNTICLKVVPEKYNLLFVLNTYDNLIKNGRMNKFVGMVASLLSIRPLFCASDGEIKLIKKIRTMTKSLASLVDEMPNLAASFNHVVISYVNNLDVAEGLAKNIKNKYANVEVELVPTRGLTTFYAQQGGIIVSFR